MRNLALLLVMTGLSIVGGNDTKVIAGKGDDTVCVSGGQVDGGPARETVRGV